jgi:hypothetical protein
VTRCALPIAEKAVPCRISSPPRRTFGSPAPLRTALKKAKASTATPEERLTAVSLLDRAARKGLIHGNAAARQKRNLAHRATA